MTARNQNPPQPIAAGDTFTIAFPIQIVGGPVDLSEAGAQYGIYANGRDGERMLFKTLGQGVRLTQEGGVWTMFVDFVPGDTDALDGDYYHEATIIRGTDRSTIAVGTITFKATRNILSGP
jgi:hypothetical protein